MLWVAGPGESASRPCHGGGAASSGMANILPGIVGSIMKATGARPVLARVKTLSRSIEPDHERDISRG